MSEPSNPRGERALQAAAAAVRRALPGLLVGGRADRADGPEFLDAGPAVGQVLLRGCRAQDGPLPGRAAGARDQRGVPEETAAGHAGNAGDVGAGHPAGGDAGPGAGVARQPHACAGPRALARADAPGPERAAQHPRAGLGRAAADHGRAGAVCRHAGAGAAHQRRARAPVCRGDRERPAKARRSRCACAAWARAGCCCTRPCPRCCRS